MSVLLLLVLRVGVILSACALGLSSSLVKKWFLSRPLCMMIVLHHKTQVRSFRKTGGGESVFDLNALPAKRVQSAYRPCRRCASVAQPKGDRQAEAPALESGSRGRWRNDGVDSRTYGAIGSAKVTPLSDCVAVQDDTINPHHPRISMGDVCLQFSLAACVSLAFSVHGVRKKCVMESL